MSISKNLINYDQAALLLAVKKSTLYSWVCSRRVPHYRISGRLVRFDPHELVAWIEDQRVAPIREEVER